MTPGEEWLGEYFPGKTLLHRLDPRTKLALTSGLAATIFLVGSAPGYGLLAGWIALGAAVGRLPLRSLLRSLKPLVMLLTVSLVVQLFTTPGRPLAALGRLVVTEEGLRQAGLIAGRFALLLPGAGLLLLTTSPLRLADGLQRLLLPLRRLGVPADDLGVTVSVALRFLPVLREEAERVVRAQLSRGARLRSGPVQERARALAAVLVPLLVGAVRRADELALAMEARGYRGRSVATGPRSLRIGPADRAVLVAGLLFYGFVAWRF